MPAITNDWAEYLKPEYSKEYYRDLFNFVGQAYATQTVYPPADDIFNAFHRAGTRTQFQRETRSCNPTFTC